MADAKINVRVSPRARRDELRGFRDGTLIVRVSAAPVDGKANKAVCRLIAKRLGVAPSRVSVARGKGSREKLISVEGVDPEALRALEAEA